MKKFLPLFLIAFLFSCTIDQGEGTFNVDAEVTNIGHTILSVKYKIGNTIVFDDIIMKDQTGILQMIKDDDRKIIPLRVQIEFSTSNDVDDTGSLKYYFGANFLSESKSFDPRSLALIADQNVDLFNWTFKDEKTFTNKKQPSQASEIKEEKLVPIDEIQEESDKL